MKNRDQTGWNFHILGDKYPHFTLFFFCSKVWQHPRCDVVISPRCCRDASSMPWWFHRDAVAEPSCRQNLKQSKKKQICFKHGLWKPRFLTHIFPFVVAIACTKKLLQQFWGFVEAIYLEIPNASKRPLLWALFLALFPRMLKQIQKNIKDFNISSLCAPHTWVLAVDNHE